jgi:hypothetical protein
MARVLYGNTPADFTLGPSGRIIPNVSLTVWTAVSGGTQVTDLLDYANAPVSSVTSDDSGLVRFYGPDGTDSTLWIQSGSGTRLAVRPVNLPRPDLEVGTVTTGTADVTLTPNGLEGYTMDLVLPSAGANGVNTAAIQNDAVTADKIAANAVGSSELADSAVDTAAIQDGAVTAAKLGADVLIGNLLTANVASGTDTLGTTAGFIGVFYSPTLARSTATASHGSGCLSATLTSASGAVFATPGTGTSGVPVEGGETYTVRFVSKAATTGKQVRPSVDFYDAGGSSVSGGSSGTYVTNSTSAWTVHQMTVTAPATAAYLRLGATINSTVIGEAHYFDDFGVWKGTGGQWAMPGQPILGLTDAPIGNLLTLNQASVEIDTTGLGGRYYCTASRSTSYAADGSASLLLTATGTEAFGGGVPFASAPAVTGGATYTAVASVRRTTGTRNAYLNLVWLDSSRAYISESATATATLTTSFQELRLTATAPANAAYVAVEVGTTTGSAADAIAVDKLGLWRGAAGQWTLPGTVVPGTSHIATNGAVHLSGTGSPEGVVTAAPGSTWLQTNATTDVKGWLRWVKATGTGNTGWVAGPEADTGWRALSPATYIGAAWTNGSVRIRRVGSMVEIAGDATGVAAHPGEIVNFLPAGFEPAQVRRHIGPAFNTSSGYQGTEFMFAAASRTVSMNRFTGSAWSSGQTTYLFFGDSWGTSSTWPSSLPDSAA